MLVNSLNIFLSYVINVFSFFFIEKSIEVVVEEVERRVGEGVVTRKGI